MIDDIFVIKVIIIICGKMRFVIIGEKEILIMTNVGGFVIVSKMQ